MFDRSDLKDLTIREFSQSAEIYDDSTRYQVVREDYPEILTELEKEPFSDLLDCGCGTGAVIALLLEDCPEAHYTGIDLVPKMIEVASGKNLPGVRFDLGDCEALPYEDESFDVLLCSHSFHHYPHPEAFLSGACRVLRPGGRLILRDNTGPWWWRMHRNLYLFPKRNRMKKNGDIRVFGRGDMKRLGKKCGLVMESFAQRPGFKMHCVLRKP